MNSSGPVDGRMGSEVTETTIMQSLRAEIGGLTHMAESLRDGLESQRGRLLGDIPPATPTPAPSGTGRDVKISGDRISFSDIDEMLQRARSALCAAGDHMVRLRKIG